MIVIIYLKPYNYIQKEDYYQHQIAEGLAYHKTKLSEVYNLSS